MSGDALGASLIQSIKKKYPNLNAEGIAGPKLIQEECKTLFPMSDITAMGLVEVLSKIPKIYKVRRNIIQHFSKEHQKPDVFIGIDSPDFNLNLEAILKRKGIPTVHYVSPTVWAWRQSRIHTIKKAVNLMLVLFPFEESFYQKFEIPVCYTGHPFADQIPMQTDTEAAKKELNRTLNIDPNQKLIALLPGSRNNELKYLAEPFIQAAKWCYNQRQDLIFIAPLVSEAHKQHLLEIKHKIAPNLPLFITLDNPRTAMQACDVALVTSGTATLEMMLHKKPMVVAYRMHPLTYQIGKRIIKVPYIALPNILANESLAPEFIQEKVIPEKMGRELLLRLEEDSLVKNIIKRSEELHLLLKQNGSEKAATAISELLK